MLLVSGAVGPRHPLSGGLEAMALGATPLPEPSAPLTCHHVTAALLDWVRSFLRAAHQFKPLDADAFKAFVLA